MFTADFLLLNHNNPDGLFELSFLDNFYANACIQPDSTSYSRSGTGVKKSTVKNNPQYMPTKKRAVPNLNPTSAYLNQIATHAAD